MIQRCVKGVALGAVATLLLSNAGSAARPSPERRATVASSYLISQQNPDGSFPGFSPLGSTADAVASLVAARRGPEAIETALDYLEENAGQAETGGQVAKLVLAAVAGGRNARSFGGRDLVQFLFDSEQASGQYGAHTAEDAYDGEVTNHVLTMLALAAAPDADPSSNSLVWLADAQCDDGGWQHTGPPASGENRHCFTGDADEDFFRSDTNTTSLAVQAIAAHAQSTAPLRPSPFRFFRAIRDERKGGWGYSWDLRLTDANSTALVIQAYAAEGRTPPDDATRALTRLQYRLCGPASKAGAFAYSYEQREGGGLARTERDPGATIAAIPALLKRPFPIGDAGTLRPAAAPRPC
jgi:hypothetical protein